MPDQCYLGDIVWKKSYIPKVNKNTLQVFNRDNWRVRRGFSISPLLSAPVEELTTFSTTWLTHTVYEMKAVSPYNGWLLRFIGLGLGLGYIIPGII